MFESLIESIKILAGKINSNVVLVGMAMILIFLLGTAPVVTSFNVCVGIITGLAFIFSLCQMIVDIAKYKMDKEKEG